MANHVLEEANEPLSTTQLSEIISKRSKGQIFKLSATAKIANTFNISLD
jgi:hypothetical protein